MRPSPPRAPVRIKIKLDDPPTVVRPAEASGLRRPLSLDWDRAIDDEHHLRRCPVCGCNDLYARKEVPQITAFLLLVVAAVVGMVLFGVGQLMWAVVALVIVLLVDLLILLKAGTVLICYRCGSEFHDLPVSRDHPRWDGALAQRHSPDRTDPLAEPELPTPADHRRPTA